MEIKSTDFLNRVTNYMNYAIKLKQLSNKHGFNAGSGREEDEGVIFVDPKCRESC